MSNKKLIILIIIFVIVGTGLYLYQIKKPSVPTVNQNNQLNCILQKTGKVAMKMYYPKEFKLSENLAKNGLISIYTYKNNSPSIVFNVGWYSGYRELNSLLNTDRIEPGPVYEVSSFNGYEAAFHEVDLPEEGLVQNYKIPYTNRVMEINYYPSTLNDTEKKLAEDMLASIVLTEVEENVAGRTVEACVEK